MRALRSEVKKARASKRAAVEAVRAECKRDRERAKVSAKRTRAAVSSKIKRSRAQKQTKCADARQGARGLGDSAIVVAQRKLKAERSYQAMLRSRAKSSKAKPGVRSAREAREESDDAVRRNIPPELRSVWERNKRRIKGGGRRSRTEAFLEWVEENADEVTATEAEDADRDVERMIAEYVRHGNPRPKRGSRQWYDARIKADKARAKARKARERAAIELVIVERERSGFRQNPHPLGKARGESSQKAAKALKRAENMIAKLGQGNGDEQATRRAIVAVQRQEHWLSPHPGYGGPSGDLAELARAESLSARFAVALAQAQEIRDAERAKYQRELRAAHRAEQPRPGTYEHELAVMRRRNKSRKAK